MHDQRVVPNVLEGFVRQPGAFQPGRYNYKRHFFFPNKTRYLIGKLQPSNCGAFDRIIGAGMKPGGRLFLMPAKDMDL
ncbi:MAG: hypothetical protein ABL936_14815, partial [Aestuariivirga sp.]